MRPSSPLLIGALGLTLFAGTVLADVSQINSVVLTNRRFNDFPTTTLTATNNYPSLVQWNETNYPNVATQSTGFANQHIASFSADGTTKFQFQNQDLFDITIHINLSAGSNTPRKEAGFRFDSLVGGEGFFHVATDNGEVAAFGGPFPFFTFGNVYTPGTTATLEMKYHPGVGVAPNVITPATMTYIYNGTSSGALNFSNNENGMINGTVDGLFVQAQRNGGTIGAGFNDSVDAIFSNITVAVPGPASTGVLAALGLLGARRRRRT
jgi:hypothetical protein